MVAIIDLSWYISLIVDSLGDRATFQRDIYLRFFSIAFVARKFFHFEIQRNQAFIYISSDLFPAECFVNEPAPIINC